MTSINSATAASLAQPQPVSPQQPQNQQDWQQFASTLNQWLQYVAGTPAAFTPTLTAAGSGNPFYTDQYGLYTQAANRVTFAARIDISGVGTLSGALSLSGLPVPAQSVVDVGVVFPVYAYGVSPLSTDYVVLGYLNAGETTISLLTQGAALPADLLASQLVAPCSFAISGSYQV